MLNKQVISHSPNDVNTTVYGQQNGEAYPLQIDSQGRLITTTGTGVDTVSVDNFPTSAFGDLRTVGLEPVAGWTFNYTLLRNLINFIPVDGGSQAVTNSMIQLDTNTSPTGSATIETRKALRYSPGLGALARFTAVFTAGVANSQQIIGVGDNTDGFFFGFNGTIFGILVRKNGIDNWIPQASWDADPMNGSGPSGVTLTPTLGNVYQIEYQWLGFGQITFSIENPNTGTYIPVHHIEYANSNVTPSILNPTLPLRASVRNTGNQTNVSLFSPSAMAFIEGPSFNQAISSRYTYFRRVSLAANTPTDLFTLQNLSTFNGKANRVRIRLDYMSFATATDDLAQFSIITGSTLTGRTFTPISAGQSVMQYSTNASYSLGTVTLYQALGEQSTISEIISSLDIWLAPGEILTFQALTQGSGVVGGSLSWTEFY